MHHYLEFEKSIAELEGKIAELRHLTGEGEVNIVEEVSKLQGKVDKQLRATYAKLTAWQKAQVARHPDRPHAHNYMDALIEDFTPLAGDRLFGEDAAIIGGLGRFRGRSVMVLGIEKGCDTESRVIHNFGMAKPEGYRKAQRLMKMADHFGLPVLTFVDTSGAFPGADAEARGQAQRILEEAGAYAAERTADARGQAARFEEIYREYARAPEVTRQRMYLETIERVLGDMDKIIIDKDAGSGVVPYLPLNELNRQGGN